MGKVILITVLVLGFAILFFTVFHEASRGGNEGLIILLFVLSLSGHMISFLLRKHFERAIYPTINAPKHLRVKDLIERPIHANISAPKHPKVKDLTKLKKVRIGYLVCSFFLFLLPLAAFVMAVASHIDESKATIFLLISASTTFFAISLFFSAILLKIQVVVREILIYIISTIFGVCFFAILAIIKFGTYFIGPR